MKTRFSRTGKQSIAIILSVLMVLSTMLSGSSVTIDTQDSATPAQIQSSAAVVDIEASGADTVYLTGSHTNVNHNAWGDVYFTQDSTSSNYFADVYMQNNDEFTFNIGEDWRKGGTTLEANNNSMATSSSGTDNFKFTTSSGSTTYRFGINSYNKRVWAWIPGTNLKLRAAGMRTNESDTADIGWSDGLSLTKVSDTDYRATVYVNSDSAEFKLYDTDKTKYMGYFSDASDTNNNNNLTYLVYNTGGNAILRGENGKYCIFHFNPQTNRYYFEETTAPTKYGITKNETSNGSYTVKVNGSEVSEASEGSNVTVSATPNAGYVTKNIIVSDGTITLLNASSTDTGTFSMPGKAVTVTVAFESSGETNLWYVEGRINATGTNWNEKTVDDKLKFTKVREGEEGYEEGYDVYRYDTNQTRKSLGTKKTDSSGNDQTQYLAFGKYSVESSSFDKYYPDSIIDISGNSYKSYTELSGYEQNSGISGSKTIHFKSFENDTSDNADDLVVLWLRTTDGSDTVDFKYTLEEQEDNDPLVDLAAKGPEAGYYRVYLTFKNTSAPNWNKPPKIHAWDSSGNQTTGEWGESSFTKIDTTKYNNLYYADIKDTSTGIIVLNGDGSSGSGNQTVNISMNSGLSGQVLTIYSANSVNETGLLNDLSWDTLHVESAVNSKVKIYAKDGTIRHTLSYKNGQSSIDVFDKFAYMADTKIYDSNNTAIGSDYKSRNADVALLETASVKRGATIKISTTIDSAYSSKYYVEGFVVNGETYKVDSTETITGGKKYSFNYTVPLTQNGAVEITPVYFYSSTEYVTFFVEDFKDDVKTAWNDTIACYAWYSQNSGDDTLSYSSLKKPALGGYPGQLMLKQGDRYYMQVPKSIDESGYTIQGITLNNYIWDDIHALILGYTEQDQQVDQNYQTYDYDDFVALQETEANGYKGAETIIARFKYRTKRDNFGNTAELDGFVKDNRGKANTGYIAKEGASEPDTSQTYKSVDVSDYANKGNGWDVLTDVNNKPVDIYDNLLNSANSTVSGTTFDSISSVESYSGEKVHIVSDGYRFVEWYIGKYATLWYVYGTDGKFKGALPPSAFLYNVGKNQTLTKANTVNDVPADFLKYSKKAFVADNPSTASKPKTVEEKMELRRQYWNTFVEIYNAGVYGKPTVITYEQEKLGGNDWAYRSDVRWLYSVPYPITSKVVIEYGTLDSNNSFVFKARDTYKKDGTTGADTHIGKTTGVSAYFTNTKSGNSGYNLNGKTEVEESDNVTSSGTDNFTFKVEQDSFTLHDDSTNKDTPYTFIGWYVEKTASDGTKTYEPVNTGSKIYDREGSYVMLTDSVLVARYVESEILTVSHKLLSSDSNNTDKPTTHNGTGTPVVTVKILTPAGEVIVAQDSTDDVEIDDIKYYYSLYSQAAAGDKDNYKLEITLSTTPEDADTSIYGVYRKDKGDSTTTYYRSNLYDNEDTEKSTIANNDSLNSSGVTNPTKNGSSVVYEYSFDKLFDSNGKLNTDILAYRTDLAKPQSINLDFKYYDRLMANNKTATINTEDTTLHYTLNNITCYEDLKYQIEGIVTDPQKKSVEGVFAGDIDNLIDTYAIWPSLSEAANAETGFGAQDYYVFDENSNVVKKKYSAYLGDKYDSYKEYHTDCYSKPQNGEDVEKWVTYYTTENGKSKDLGITADKEENLNVSNVTSVTVWAFNYPKQYSLTTYTDKKVATSVLDDNGNAVKDEAGNVVTTMEFAGTKLKSTPVVGDATKNDALYALDISSNDVLNFEGFYNQRVGGHDVLGATTNNSDMATNYLKHYFGLTEDEGIENPDEEKLSAIAYTGDEVDAPLTAKILGDDQTEYAFDGWYTIADNGNYVKVSSDRFYGNRITSNLSIHALYKKVVKDVKPTGNVGVSVTRNGEKGVDYYVEEINGAQYEKVRLNTQLNVFYDGAQQDNDDRIQQVAVIYVQMGNDNDIASDDKGYISNSDGVYVIDDDSEEAIINWIDEHKATIFTFKKVQGNNTSRKSGWITLNVNNSDKYYYIMTDTYDVTGGYSYDESASNPSLTLTSKNRVQFVLPMDIELYKTSYDKLIALAAIKYDADGKDNNGEWVVSENYISFITSAPQ